MSKCQLHKTSFNLIDINSSLKFLFVLVLTKTFFACCRKNRRDLSQISIPTVLGFSEVARLNANSDWFAKNPI